MLEGEKKTHEKVREEGRRVCVYSQLQTNCKRREKGRCDRVKGEGGKGGRGCTTCK